MDSCIFCNYAKLSVTSFCMNCNALWNIMQQKYIHHVPRKSPTIIIVVCSGNSQLNLVCRQTNIFIIIPADVHSSYILKLYLTSFSLSLSTFTAKTVVGFVLSIATMLKDIIFQVVKVTRVCIALAFDHIHYI